MKYIILGAGPSGLTIANLLKRAGINSFLVLEKESEVGGLCRSTNVDGSPFDFGGGHFLDVRRKHVNDFLFEFMPEREWNLFERDSRIIVNGNEVGHPIESNIWQMKIEDQVSYLKSIAVAGCNLNAPMPKQFVNWIFWKLGERIANDYMIPYNQKMFNKELDELGTYWLEKLPNVSFDDTLRSCLERKPYGTQPGHTQFYYPKKYGYGELWKRMGDACADKIMCCSEVKSLDCDTKKVKTADGESYSADCIISTMPWTSFTKIEGMPEEIIQSIHKLKYSSIETRYYAKTINSKAHWIYYPNPRLAYHRILVRRNFCPNSKGYWTETNSQRVDLIPTSEQKNFNYMNEYAYPLNTIEKPAIMEKLLSWAKCNNIYGLGRWGEWQHYNSDVTVDRAIDLAKELVGEKVGLEAEKRRG